MPPHMSVPTTAPTTVPAPGTTPRARDWPRLTTVPEKIHYYIDDLAFRDGWATARKALGDQWATALQRTALLTLRPDGIAHEALDGTLAFLAGQGFDVIAAHSVRYGANRARELWRYQWNAATADRLAVTREVLDAGDGLLIVCFAAGPLTTPASSLFARTKGSALPEARLPGDLRTLLGAPNRVLTLVHAADEPADVLRELPIVLSRTDQAATWRAVRAADDARRAGRPPRTVRPVGPPARGPLPELPAAVRTLLRHTTEHHHCAARRLGALLDALVRTPHDAPQHWREHGIDWELWATALHSCGADHRSWESLVVASHAVVSNLAADSLIRGAGRSRWLNGEGDFVAA
ncbi:hypothetical protein J7E97_13675 [Streptomyces sp. ISL-66]|uniref:nucleoside-diphosphate kinase n=1 Tax=Streptomyces sp. ISL-66 TaxID=2819186 RepID=UPI001BE58A39|nr:nucleoside-diphosphate kinase [Streptomyces sp. ISL-66]MBT2468897.1 hypothetical protein [Streptomyces sp. ISL-66]